MAAVLDDLDVGVVDGLFVVLDAGGPIRGGTKDLTESRKSVRVRKGDTSCSHSIQWMALTNGFLRLRRYFLLSALAIDFSLMNSRLRPFQTDENSMAL